MPTAMPEMSNRQPADQGREEVPEIPEPGTRVPGIRVPEPVHFWKEAVVKPCLR